MSKAEKCIMPKDPNWKTERFEGSHRHEVFYGPYRQKSIEDGLVIFLRPEMHNMGDYGIHKNREFDLYAKRRGQKAWMKLNGKTVDEFRQRYGKNYL
jgi:hypothetical protein